MRPQVRSGLRGKLYPRVPNTCAMLRFVPPAGVLILPLTVLMLLLAYPASAGPSWARFPLNDVDEHIGTEVPRVGMPDESYGLPPHVWQGLTTSSYGSYAFTACSFLAALSRS
jgi:hypothetical protein